MINDYELSLKTHLQSEVSGVTIRVREETDVVDKKSMITISTESSRLFHPQFSDLFELVIRVELSMNGNDNTAAEMETAGTELMDALTETDLKDTLSAVMAKVQDTRTQVSDGMWSREVTIRALAVGGSGGS